MNLPKKPLKIFRKTIPLLAMIGFIPFIANDWILLGIYILIIMISFLCKYQKHEWIFFVFGMSIMTISEYLFISTGVETFERDSLFGLMPIWLPILWAYGFVAIKRAAKILE